MQTILLKCPFTGEVINKRNAILHYLKFESKKRGININLLKYLVYEKSFGEIASKKVFTEYYIDKQYSLPLFKKEFLMGYRITEFLIDYHGCKKRTHKEAAKIGAKRAKKTNLQKYGVDQTFKVEKFDKKRKNTYLKKYGVDNPFKMKNFVKKAEEGFFKKYGITRKEYYKDLGKKLWEQRSEESKLLLIESGKNLFSNGISKLETRIALVLSEFEIKYETQKKVGRYYFDFYFPELNVLSEVNGTIFHADPKIYSSEDIMPLTGRLAKDIWAKDKEKYKKGIDKGYKICYFWEKEICGKNQELDLFDFVYERIVETAENKINQENWFENSL